MTSTTDTTSSPTSCYSRFAPALSLKSPEYGNRPPCPPVPWRPRAPSARPATRAHVEAKPGPAGLREPKFRPRPSADGAGSRRERASAGERHGGERRVRGRAFHQRGEHDDRLADRVRRSSRSPYVACHDVPAQSRAVDLALPVPRPTHPHARHLPLAADPPPALPLIAWAALPDLSGKSRKGGPARSGGPPFLESPGIELNPGRRRPPRRPSAQPPLAPGAVGVLLPVADEAARARPSSRRRRSRASRWVQRPKSGSLPGQGWVTPPDSSAPAQRLA